MKNYFLITRLRLGYNLTILTSLNQVEMKFSKFTFKKFSLENYLVKARLKSLKITKSWFYLRFEHSLFFREDNVITRLFAMTSSKEWLDSIIPEVSHMVAQSHSHIDPAQTSFQYSICFDLGNVSWMKLHTNLRGSWAKLVSGSRSLERIQIDV